MSTKRVISLTNILYFFRDARSQFQEGEHLYHSGNVTNVSFDSTVQPGLLKGEVKEDMVNLTYTVEELIDPEDGIIRAQCSCPGVKLICCHLAALCLHGHYNIKVTDEACASNAPNPSSSESSPVKPIQEIFRPKNIEFCNTPRYASQEAIDEFISSLDENCYFAWLLKKEDRK